jgi:hypothetical protein
MLTLQFQMDENGGWMATCISEPVRNCHIYGTAQRAEVASAKQRSSVNLKQRGVTILGTERGMATEHGNGSCNI